VGEQNSVITDFRLAEVATRFTSQITDVEAGDHKSFFQKMTSQQKIRSQLFCESAYCAFVNGVFGWIPEGRGLSMICNRERVIAGHCNTI
jgi:hypothetical protein